ncbi:FeoA family protein [Iningainema tapete]|uniref:Ferrous iron transport protein A n=1 Tax=Iningainema tapete BLCC-T55 TaxID=2748662 RepID=A0A8J7CA39_9CYAN|nr:FeoA family protein [Iningainema tapete]MBD2778859.1 ferrous iron transport protein A [Iningainema tapete BLCC-T55]
MHLIELSQLEPGETALISGLVAEAGLEQRLLALGFRPGRQVRMIRKAWFSGPLHVRIGTTEVMVRRRDAQAIKVEYRTTEAGA